MLETVICLPTVFLTRFFLKKLTNQKQELPMAAMFVNRSYEICNLYRGPSIDASYQLWLIWSSDIRGEDF